MAGAPREAPSPAPSASRDRRERLVVIRCPPPFHFFMAEAPAARLFHPCPCCARPDKLASGLGGARLEAIGSGSSRANHSQEMIVHVRRMSKKLLCMGLILDFLY